MRFADLRRKINDSQVGQKINGSVPGIRFEGFCRGISDRIADYRCKIKNAVAEGLTIIGHRSGIELSYNATQEYIDHYSIYDGSPAIHYSHKSRLYKVVPLGPDESWPDGSRYVFQRVPVSEALQAKKEN